MSIIHTLLVLVLVTPQMRKVPYLFYVLSCVKGFKLVNTVPLYHFEAPVSYRAIEISFNDYPGN